MRRSAKVTVAPTGRRDRRFRVRRLAPWFALIVACAGCPQDRVEHSEQREDVGPFALVTRCTVRRPWVPDSVVDTKCQTTLLDGKGILLQPAVYVAVQDPTGRFV